MHRNVLNLNFSVKYILNSINLDEPYIDTLSTRVKALIKLMDIPRRIIEGIFLERPNKFVVIVKVDKKKLHCHLTDTGRLIKLLIPGNRILIREKSVSAKRKTRCEVLAAMDLESREWILINPSMHSDIVEEIIRRQLVKDLTGYSIVKREFYYGNSRIDFLLKPEQGKYALLEVKGCTLFENNIGYYPDAPTKRGTRHLSELIAALQEGYESYLFLLVPRLVREVRPNWRIDPIFSQKMLEAYSSGVKMLASSIQLRNNAIYFVKQLQVNPTKNKK